MTDLEKAARKAAILRAGLQYAISRTLAARVSTHELDDIRDTARAVLLITEDE